MFARFAEMLGISTFFKDNSRRIDFTIPLDLRTKFASDVIAKDAFSGVFYLAGGKGYYPLPGVRTALLKRKTPFQASFTWLGAKDITPFRGFEPLS